MFSLIPAIYRAWQAGQIIRNPAKWKSGGEVGAYVTVFVTNAILIIVYFFPSIKDFFTAETVALIVSFFTTGLMLAFIVINRITTRKKVGLDVLTAEAPEPEYPGRRFEDSQAIPPPEPGRWAESSEPREAPIMGSRETDATGRGDSKLVILDIKGRMDDKKDLGTPSGVGQRDRKVTPQGQDVL